MSTIKYPIILFLVLSLGLSQALLIPRHVKKPPRNQPSQVLYQRVLRDFNLLRQTSSITRLPNRVLNPPSLGTPYLTINISWDLPVPRSSVSFSTLDLKRGEVDTAISFGSYTFGHGCNDTFSLSSVDFSGDDVYAPGWEAYLVTYPLPLQMDDTTMSSTAEPESESESESGTSFTINIYATLGSLFSSNVYLNVDLFDANGKMIINDTLSFEQVAPAYDGCAAVREPIAKLLVNDFSTFELTEEEVDFSPTFSPEPQVTTEPEEEPEPQVTTEPEEEPEPSVEEALSFPPTLSASYLFVNFSWVNGFTDLESGFEMSQLFPDAFSTCSVSPYVITSGNNFQLTGFETFTINFQTLRENDIWNTTDIVITLLAGWWSTIPSTSRVKIDINMIPPLGEPVRDIFTINLSDPSLPTSGCTPITPIAEVYVNYFETNNSHVISKVEQLELPILPMSSPEEEEEEEEEDASAEPSFEPPVLPEILDEKRLLVTFSWPSDQSDLDSAVRIASIARGVSCFDGGSLEQPIILFNGDSTDYGGSESYIVRLGLAQSYGYWNDNLDVDLSGFWYGRLEFNGSEATIAVELKDENNVSLDKLEKTFNPFNLNNVNGSFPGPCNSNKVGRVRVTDNNGTLAMDFGIY